MFSISPVHKVNTSIYTFNSLKVSHYIYLKPNSLWLKLHRTSLKRWFCSFLCCSVFFPFFRLVSLPAPQLFGKITARCCDAPECKWAPETTGGTHLSLSPQWILHRRDGNSILLHPCANVWLEVCVLQDPTSQILLFFHNYTRRLAVIMCWNWKTLWKDLMKTFSLLENWKYIEINVKWTCGTFWKHGVHMWKLALGQK